MANMTTAKTKRDHYKIEVFTHHYPGYGSDAPPSDEIKIVCNNRVLAFKYNLSEVGEYLLIQKWKKRAKKPGFEKILRCKKLAFSLCYFCKNPIKEDGGSVCDISYCTPCDEKGLIDQYVARKKSEQEEQQKQDETRQIASEDRRKQKLVLRCKSIRSGKFLGNNECGEFWSLKEKGKIKIFFIKRNVEWEFDIQDAILKGPL